jgi:hypothetical protein
LKKKRIVKRKYQIKPPTVQWAYDFIQKHHELKAITPSEMDDARIRATCKESLSAYCVDLHNLLKENN